MTELGELVFVGVIKLRMEGRDHSIEEGPGSSDEYSHKRKAEGGIRPRTIRGEGHMKMGADTKAVSTTKECRWLLTPASQEGDTEL